MADRNPLCDVIRRNVLQWESYRLVAVDKHGSIDYYVEERWRDRMGYDSWRELEKAEEVVEAMTTLAQCIYHGSIRVVKDHKEEKQ